MEELLQDMYIGITLWLAYGYIMLQIKNFELGETI